MTAPVLFSMSDTTFIMYYGIIIRWNSGLYNDTKKAIEDFQKYMDRVRDRATGKLPSEEAGQGK